MFTDTSHHISRRTIILVSTTASILLLFHWPLDITYWLQYGNFFTETFVDNINALKNDFCVALVYDQLGVIKYFLQYAKPIYEYPILFLTAGVFLKVIEIILLYKIMRRLEFLQVTALMFAVFMPFSGGIMGAAPNGLITYINFNKAIISALLSLAGIYFILANKHALGGVCLALACYFHIPYGSTALVFVAAGILWHDAASKQWRPLFLLLIMSGFTLMPLVWQTYQMGHLVVNPIGMAAWYQYWDLSSVWGQDLLMLAAVLATGLDFIVPCVTYLTLRLSNRITKRLDGIIFAGLALIAASLTLEQLHARGVFLGKVSEIFISIQMRRGVWIPYFACYFGLVRILWDSKNANHITWQWTLAFWSILFWLKPYPVLAIIIATTLLIYIWQLRRPWIYFLGPISIFSMLVLKYYTTPVEYAHTLQTLIMQAAVILPIAFLAAGIQLLPSIRGDYRIALPVILLLSVLTVRHIPKWYSQLRLLSLHGWLSPISSVGLNRLSEGNSDLSESPASTEYKVLAVLQQVNPNHYPVLMDPALANLEGRVPNVLAPYWCNIPVYYSYQAASLISRHFDEVFGKHFSLRGLLTPGGYSSIFRSLTASDIQILFDKKGVGALVSTRLYPELKIVAKVNGYHIYAK